MFISINLSSQASFQGNQESLQIDKSLSLLSSHQFSEAANKWNLCLIILSLKNSICFLIFKYWSLPFAQILTLLSKPTGLHKTHLILYSLIKLETGNNFYEILSAMSREK